MSHSLAFIRPALAAVALLSIPAATGLLAALLPTPAQAASPVPASAVITPGETNEPSAFLTVSDGRHHHRHHQHRHHHRHQPPPWHAPRSYGRPGYYLPPPPPPPYWLMPQPRRPYSYYDHRRPPEHHGRLRRDRDGDGVPDRHDAAPHDPWRY